MIRRPTEAGMAMEAGHGRRVAVVGLGYVGLPVAAAFAEAGPVIGYDVDPARVAELQAGADGNATVGADRLVSLDLEFTSDPGRLHEADFIVVAVPTPIDDAKHPDLSAIRTASRTVGETLRPGTIVVYESTVYPGVTEEVCVPLLEAASGLECGRGFFVGYSPERINPGDEAHGFADVVKVVSGCDSQTLDLIARVYRSVVPAGVHRAASIRVAEAAKVIENTQRDLNIAFMNELAVVFDRMGIDTGDVLAAAETKWNFVSFTPGLVGGHCIGVDPYYLTYQAMRTGYHPHVILAGRRVNDETGSFVAASVVRLLIKAGLRVKGTTVTVLGAAFKANVPDVRNTGVAAVVRSLLEHDVDVQVHDPLVDPRIARSELGIAPVTRDELRPARALVLAVAHAAWGKSVWDLVTSLLEKGSGIVADVPRMLARDETPPGVTLWRL